MFASLDVKCESGGRAGVGEDGDGGFALDVAGVVVTEGVTVGEGVEGLQCGGNSGGLEHFGAAFLEGFDLGEDFLSAGRGGDGDEFGEGELERGRGVGDGVAGVEEGGEDVVEHERKGSSGAGEQGQDSNAARRSLYPGGLGLVCARSDGAAGAGNQDLRRVGTA